MRRRESPPFSYYCTELLMGTPISFTWIIPAFIPYRPRTMDETIAVCQPQLDGLAMAPEHQDAKPVESIFLPSAAILRVEKKLTLSFCRSSSVPA